MKEIFLFKIRDKNTGLYSTGGMSPRWTKRGKTWNQLNHLKTHLRQFLQHPRKYNGSYMDVDWKILINNIPESWEVVKIKIVESETELLNARSFYPEQMED